MNSIIKAIASIMIIVLIILLIWIFLLYYRNNELIDTIVVQSGDPSSTINIPSGEYMTENNDINDKENLVESIIGENQPATNKEENNQEEGNSGDSKENVTEKPSNNEEKVPNENILISSELQTSNQEKQEVLSEIDEALQGLLEAVGKVETVDETRLDATLNSEVSEP